ncbi:MAG: hypothetical protein KC731_26235, partial [Myxococcales bacterium]|nr:hypothetical protein [Myxococcales bacterium]
FSEALRLGHDHPERLAAFHLWRGRAQDLAGRRDEALVDYRWALGHHADTPIREAARKNLERPYRGGRVEIDFTFGDVMAP